MPQYIFLLIVLASCTFQGLVGFGFAMVAVPLSLYFLPPNFVIPSMTFISLALNLYLMFKIHQPLDKKFINQLIIFGVLGMPLGLMILNYFPAWELKLFAAIVALGTALVALLPKFKLPNSLWVERSAGFLAGILTTSVNINGAPIAALLIARGFEREKFRHTLAVYFSLMSIYSLFFLSSKIPQMLINPKYLSVLVITAIAGGVIGHHLSKRLNVRNYKLVAVATITLSSVISFIK